MATAIVTLKPCPFCGGPPALDFEPEIDGYFAYCLNANARAMDLDLGSGFGDCPCSPVTGPHEALEDAVAGWNERTDLGVVSTSFAVDADGTVTQRKD